MKTFVFTLSCLLALSVTAPAQTAIYTYRNGQNSVERFGMPGKGWAECDNVWYYYGYVTNLGPDEYSKISKTARAALVRKTRPGKPERLGLERTETTETAEQTRCTYTTDAPGWRWNGSNWLFEGKKVKAFPPTFTAHRHTTETKSVQNGQGVVQHTEIIRDTGSSIRYTIAERGWKWNPAKKRWMWKGSLKGFPPYKNAL